MTKSKKRWLPASSNPPKPSAKVRLTTGLLTTLSAATLSVDAALSAERTASVENLLLQRRAHVYIPSRELLGFDSSAGASSVDSPSFCEGASSSSSKAGGDGALHRRGRRRSSTAPLNTRSLTRPSFHASCSSSNTGR